MKKQITTFTKLSEYELAKLTRPVDETLAIAFIVPQQKTFTAAELWDIQRRQKNRVQRRFIF